MYHIVKDVASLITMSSENQSLTALSLRVSHLQTGRLNTSKLGQLTTKKTDQHRTLNLDPQRSKPL